MATISPTTAVSAKGVVTITWAGVSTADTMTAVQLADDGAEFAACQMTGTWGSATVTLAGSEDDTTYLTVKDRTGTAVSATANARFDNISTAAKYLKPASTGGTADNVDVVLTLRRRK